MRMTTSEVMTAYSEYVRHGGWEGCLTWYEYLAWEAWEEEMNMNELQLQYAMANDAQGEW